MALRKRTDGDDEVSTADDDRLDEISADDEDGPFDIEDFDDADVAAQGRLDLGSVLVPMPENAQLQVELNASGVPSAIWLVTANGRYTIAAYAAPKSPGLWREVATELADSLRGDGATVSIQSGPWGREVVGTAAGAVRFIGVDGYRWMIRCVVNGAPDTIDALAGEARKALADTVVRRGEEPMPVRTPLPVQLPEPMAAQLRAAQEQAAAQAQAQAAAAQPGPPADEPSPETAAPVARRSTHSAMQRFNTITGG
ncbi:DUF3710 domain-containing protein [Mycolicibacterium brumae]|uniref:DUF3710 domain-containing protein n=1 Tax=Mycolicibacterium brumae TaxID=85968 RepID=A0A2G5PDN7_9MYCO|nr:DUF3710 domain-containing protein [Mycolicibacterium brumae]MCV7193514.1 DUF3710 domain-containing protein [Mycolicibacterium brumae]PIB76200.1 DUF3710 domain-containing protein [Mycolicibacterium brumae]UWW09213.1 DUF3710 domain-containing protein [Mycolicibacterium brumae]